MGIIHTLPAAVINQIAAGEVVERPASVVKELLENAIDAGATRVEVTVERGGKDLVRVADNGSGMDRDDLLLAFQPHATSKLTEAEDLCRIRTLGFRGEALAAIAEVAKVRCQTRTADAAIGSEIVIEVGTASSIRDCGTPPGSVIEVRNLFYNTPVRRTFLKSDTTEAGHVVEMIMRVALAHPTVQITYKSGSRVVHDLPSVTGLKERIAVFFGRELAESILWVESNVERIHIWGYVAHPSQSRSSTKGQYLFVGGRYVRDRALGHALSEAYRGLLMVGRIPVAFLHLEIPPEEVDVNVHPTKVEVRFRDSHRVYSQLLSTVRQTFLASDLHTQLQAPASAAKEAAGLTLESADRAGGDRSFAFAQRPDERQAVGSWFTPGGANAGGFKTFPMPGYAGGPAAPAWARSLPPAVTTTPGDSFDEFGPPTATVADRTAGSPQTTSVADSVGESVVESSAPSNPAGPAPFPLAELPPRALQVHDSYLVAETSDGMVVIDQHALHERILYEELRQRVEQGGVEAQRLLVPEPVDLTAAEAAEVLERRDLLARLGLEIEPFGGDTVLVNSMPAMLAGAEPSRLLRDLADHFRATTLPPTPAAVLEDILNMVACKAAVKAGQRLSPGEVTALLERRHLVSNTHHCPHGRPTALTFTKAELEKQFGRI
ncbi:MAG TPA: DNA mismatch repair endonuclease MutL [Isosphaeraceae bacterium]|jgi:DNA mismatch repair protein MutL|nr:DNA mismatch repair endonuclease MutL [Isosphaeraceae bacterium]